MGSMDTGATSPRVLVVDDDADVLASLERGLRLSGFEVATGVDVDLAKREFDLLAVLAEHKTAVLSRAQLLELVWGYDFAADTNVVDVFIGYLRRKLEAGGGPRLLHTVRGVGFVLRLQ